MVTRKWIWTMRTLRFDFTVICDSREQKWSHVQEHFDMAGVKWMRSKLPIGDYGRLDNLSVVVDRKQHLSEVEGNLIQQHDRFRREAIRAQENGIRLIVLVEEENIGSLEGVKGWENPRRKKWERINQQHAFGKQLHISIPSRPPVTGLQLWQIMHTMAEKYGIEWRFCPHESTGAEILRILSGGA